MIKRALSQILALLALAGAACSSDVAEPNQSLALALGGTGDGTVTSTPAGISCTLNNGNQSGTCTASFEFDAVVNLTAQAASGSSFLAWGSGCSGAGTCTAVMNQARAITGSFAPVLHALTITPTGNGSGTVVSNPAGISCVSINGTPAGVCTASFKAGTVVTLTATTNVTSTFQGWTGGCTGTAGCSVTVNAPSTVSSGFQLINYPITISPNGNGSGSVQSNPAGISCTVTSGVAGGTCAGDFAVGTVITLTPTSGATSSFGGWSGSCSGNGNCQLVADGAKPVTASFSQLVHTVTVTGGGTGSGTVTSSPAGISCTITNGVASGGTCQASFAAGIAVGLTATPAANQSFSGWGGSCTGTGSCALTVNGARSVTASFAPNKHTIAVALAGVGSGTVTSAPAGINCSILGGNVIGTCTADFNPGATVTLTATASGASSFTGWGGACSGSSNCIFPSLDGSKQVTASFGQVVLHPVTITGGGNGSGTVTSSPSGINGCVITNGVAAASGCSTSFPQGTNVTLTVAPNPGSGFTGWAGPCGGAGNCQFTLNAPASVTASFTLGAFTLTVTGGGNGTGTVTSSPAGISCTIFNGVAQSAGCSGSFASGAVVTLTATPSGGGHSFSGWGAPCFGTGTCQITMSANQAVTATFAASASGVFTMSPDFRVLSPGQAVALTAKAPDGSTTGSPPVATSSSSPGIASVSGLTVTGGSSGVADITGTLNAQTDQSRIAVVQSAGGIAIIVTRAADSAFMNVTAGATFSLDVWLIHPSGGSGNIASIQGAIGWDPARFQYVSFGSPASGWSLVPNESSTGTGTLGFGAFSITGTSGSFSLARLTLRAIGSSSTTAVTPSFTAAGDDIGTNILSKILAVPSSLRIP